jgi:hypothetical protein
MLSLSRRRQGKKEREKRKLNKPAHIVSFQKHVKSALKKREDEGEKSQLHPGVKMRRDVNFLHLGTASCRHRRRCRCRRLLAFARMDRVSNVKRHSNSFSPGCQMKELFLAEQRLII